MDDNRHVEAGIRAIAERFGEGLMVIQQGRVVFSNDRIAEILGMNRQVYENRDLGQFLDEKSPYRGMLDRQAEVENGRNVLLPDEVEIRRRTGRPVHVRHRSSLIQWNGRPATVHFLEDFTLPKTTEKQLVEQKEVNSILADTVRRILASPLSLEEIAATVLDSAMNLTSSRSGVLMIQDQSGLELMERRCSGQCPRCAIPDLLASIESDEALMNRRRPGRIDGAFYLNETHPISEMCPQAPDIRNILRVPARNASSISGQIILAGTENGFGPWDLDNMEKIAEVLNLALVQKEAVDKLQAAKDDAEREAESRSLFLANVSHEIRSPLNGVLMMASLLKDSDLDAEQGELVDVVMSSARTIDRLIRDLTDLTQIRTGKFTIHEEDFDFDELCRHIIETNRPETLRKGLILDSVIEPEAAWFHGDRERLGQIIANLVTNAIRYTERGRVELRVSVSEEELHIDVSDTGVGIPSEEQTAVFGLFHQGSASQHRKSQGTGIGLAVVKELAEVMNGRVLLESRSGEGSRFTVVLPRRSSTDRRSAATSVRPGTRGGGRRILVVEDEGVNRLYLRSLLERDGYEVDEAANGLEAVSVVRNGDFDLILMDVSMPKMDGLEASGLIREMKPDIPIIAVTAHAYDVDRNRIRDRGLDDVILKPVDETSLKRRLARYLSPTV